MRPRYVVTLIVLLTLSLFVIPRVRAYIVRQHEIAIRSNVIVPMPEVPHVFSSVASMSSSSLPRSSAAPESPRVSVNWAVPFTPQAPTGNWDIIHEEACEEASILMVLRYFTQKSIESPSDAEKGIQVLLSRNAELGYSVDLTAEQTAFLVRDQDPSLRVSLFKDPTVEDLKRALSNGSLIIVPAAGRQLGNPYFSGAGPLYHMLVLRGYTKDGHVITNDPGTKRGEQFLYTWDRLVSAIHDWNGGEVESGEKVVVVVGRN